MMGFYVYELADPRDGVAFYVGKGCGKRAWRHAEDVRRGRAPDSPKAKRIAEIIAAGLDVTVRMLAEHLPECEAFRIERAEIAARREALTNIRPGGEGASKAVDYRVEATRAMRTFRAVDLSAVAPEDMELAEFVRRSAATLAVRCMRMHRQGAR